MSIVINIRSAWAPRFSSLFHSLHYKPRSQTSSKTTSKTNIFGCLEKNEMFLCHKRQTFMFELHPRIHLYIGTKIKSSNNLELKSSKMKKGVSEYFSNKVAWWSSHEESFVSYLTWVNPKEKSPAFFAIILIYMPSTNH